MTISEAEKIVQQYSAYYVECNEKKNWETGPQIFSSFELPYSSAKIKFAFLAVVEHLVKTGIIDRSYDQLRMVYSSIDGTFKENAEEINSALLEYDRRIKQLTTAKPVNLHALLELEELKFKAKYDGINPDLPDANHFGEVELHNFIVDLESNWGLRSN